MMKSREPVILSFKKFISNSDLRDEWRIERMMDHLDKWNIFLYSIMTRAYEEPDPISKDAVKKFWENGVLANITETELNNFYVEFLFYFYIFMSQDFFEEYRTEIGMMMLYIPYKCYCEARLKVSFMFT